MGSGLKGHLKIHTIILTHHRWQLGFWNLTAKLTHIGSITYQVGRVEKSQGHWQQGKIMPWGRLGFLLSWRSETSALGLGCRRRLVGRGLGCAAWRFWRKLWRGCEAFRRGCRRLWWSGIWTRLLGTRLFLWFGSRCALETRLKCSFKLIVF